ncbi:MAG: alkaline phosphatase family protein [Candidatus Delongbacteria bacterium]|jgi:hypothetical protein|nr:alkaline phosphatase family protein [Candidatus Delongbacteria bacterium]
MSTSIKNKSLFIAVVGIFILNILIFSGCSDQGYRHYVKVAGDVNNVLFFNSFNDQNSIALEEIINKADPFNDKYSILLVGSDGLTAEIDNRMDKITLNFSKINGWEIIDENHPISARIKHLKEIIIVSKEDITENSVIIFNSEKNLISMTPGQLYQKSLERRLIFQGHSSIIRDDGEYAVTVYTTALTYSLDELEGSRYLIISESGKTKYTDKPGYLVYRDNSIDYLDPEMKNEIVGIKGILIDPPKTSISNAYYDALHYIENGEKVMVIFLDGFSYIQYKYAIENNIAPYLNQLPAAQKATTYFKPVTNVGFATMITGKGPDDNGIHDRSCRKLNSSIFTVLKEKGFSSKLVEANVSILDHGADEMLNIDKNGNGSIDDEVFYSAMKEIEKEYDYILVHFHEIDDMGHQFGPFGKETLEQIKTKDGYVKELVNNFDGRIIILADHGMHETEDGGTHCQTRCEDFIVPYITVAGGKK